ncbi:MAG: metal-dependent transcriptional regulator [Acidobacteria bacterium]|nr:metal-dependent transcriptional regulator [Acidobacteriota bacterium]
MPSSTVENYLKAIYLGTGALSHPNRLLPMGHLAAALGVAPGTATTMVKTLSESGLVEYEPYTGVALTEAGEKLAALVVRRHRVVELFLVRFMGYGWDEVHDEAEQLEHVVSDRLIDRMDEMLGRPEVDPHGDPIPDPEGIVKPQPAQTLLTCPLHTQVTITRVIDQDKSFLRFIENHHLKPGESIEVEDRNAVSDSVRVRGKDDQRITIGTRAASKVLVHVTVALMMLLALGASASAQIQPQAQPQTRPPARPFEILDNSFLVEEAFNQEPGIFQNIFTARLGEDDTWEAAFTQEWPLFSQAHQFSYTIAALGADGERAFGDVMINYRWQATMETASAPAFSPRISLIVATGDGSLGLNGGGAGWQVNLPFSKQFGDTYVHWNAGFTHRPEAQATGRCAHHNLLTPHAAVSGIWRLRPMFNLMLESVAEWEEFVDQAATRRAMAWTVSPGFRTGLGAGLPQTIVGFAVPVAVSDDGSTVGVFGYFSYELAFIRQP